ncbi:LOW QUALITY PROTEIN: tagatose 1,6-bisphosphate aldolase [Bacillus sp. JCM 19047]|nr:LOW QUALITY PROTEIN: tagatose 1,6-bisphosphate aldolase [Bacillus sp. JCM 19047]
MGLQSTTPMLEKAKANKHGIVAFNVHSFDSIFWVLEAAAALKSPVILQTTVGTVQSLKADNLVRVAKAAAEHFNVPTGLHLDHCTDYNVIKEAIRAGYTSVMIDASMHPFDENVARTKEVVALAKTLGVNIEAELGKVGGVEDDIVVAEEDAQKAIPEECKRFVEQTGVPTLHQLLEQLMAYTKGNQKLILNELNKLLQSVDVPLVLHGGSAVPEEDVRRCVELGMAKVNVSTELKNAYSEAIRQHFEDAPESLDPRAYLQKAKEAAIEMAKSKIRMVGSENTVVPAFV